MQAFVQSFTPWHLTKRALNYKLRIKPTTYHPYCCTTRPNHPQSPSTSFKILNDEPIFQRYQTIYQRDVRYPNGSIVSYDILGTPHADFQSVFVFPYNTTTRTVTMLREYAPGQNCVHPAFVAGMYEPDKHTSLEDAAAKELSEEAHLMGGRLVPLGTQPTPADKYSRNLFWFYIALDCTQDGSPAQRDPEEWIEVVEGVQLDEVRSLVRNGSLNTPHSLLAMLAMDWIECSAALDVHQ